jgi:hypothetical protein
MEETLLRDAVEIEEPYIPYQLKLKGHIDIVSCDDQHSLFLLRYFDLGTNLTCWSPSLNLIV